MKNLFSRECFHFTDFDKSQRRQSIITVCMLCLTFIASAFTFMNALYCFADAVGCIVSGSPDVAIKEFLRSVPLFLSFFMTLWALLLVHALYRNASEERRQRSLTKNAIAILCFAGVNILYIIVGLITGRYLSITEGSPSPIYPLDALLYSILFIGIGVFVLFYKKKLQNTFPYVVPGRGPIVTRGRFGYCLLISIWMLFALFCFSGFFIGLFIVDFAHGYLAYSIAILVVYFVNALFFIIWELYYNEVKEEHRKDILLPLGIIGLCVSIAAAIFYFVALKYNLDGPANVGFGILPVAFAASVNIATMLVVMVPVIASLVAFIKGLVLRKNK